MTLKVTTIAALVALTTTPVFAQTAANTPEPTSTTVATDAQGRALIGAPLGYNAASGGIGGEAETLFVIDGNNMKPAGEWTASDRKACSDSGGIELPVSAGRVACFRL